MKKLFKEKNRGLTMIELIVAIGIFSVIITIVVSLFVSALRGYRKNLALQNVQENARFLLDFITKELRMSTVDAAMPNGELSYLTIIRPDNSSVNYSFTSNNLNRVAGSSSGPINSDEVMVTGRFYISGAGNDNLEPKVTVVLKIENKWTKSEEKASINLQATLSQRNIEAIEL